MTPGGACGLVRRVAIGVLVALLAVVPATWGEDAHGKLDLNRATREEIRKLPVPEKVADAIYEHRTYTEFFGSIYDLMEVPGMTPELLEALRPLVATLAPDRRAEVFERYDNAFRQVQQYLAEEGAREEVADEYLDLLRTPRNVNRMSALELQGFQNVSPVDAVAIVKARERAGEIETDRQLRTSDGLSYWGYRNLRDYVIYDERAEHGEVHGDVQMLSFNRPYRLDDADILLEPLGPNQPVPSQPRPFQSDTGWGVRGLDSANPAVAVKVHLRLGTAWRGGLLTFRDVGEQHLSETLKGFAMWRNPTRRKAGIDRAIIGQYRLAFGQGLVLDNSDFFVARKSGYGYNIRPTFPIGDLARSQEYNLRGLALEGHAGPIRAVGFVSHDKKDGLVNPDGSLNRYVTLTPRFENYELEAMQNDDVAIPFGLRRDAFRETMYGGNVQAHLWTGTHVGVSGWEARHDQHWNPDVTTLIYSGNIGRLEARDRELFTAYDSRELGKFRRVFGAEFQTVYQNVAVQGEYAKLDANPAGGLDGLLGAAPEAFTANAYVQYEDLNVQVLWRDYDVGFDNPYARGFSEDPRYEQTLLEDPFRVQNPLLSFIPRNTPQMKAERGLYIQARYRVTRNFTIDGLEFDDWTRVADGQDMRRWVLRMTYSPIFPLRFRVRQRFSSRGEQVQDDFRRFRGWDTRLETIARLSGWDQLSLLLVTGSTEFAPRPRLSGSVEPVAGNAVGQAGSPAHALVAIYSHYVNDRLLLGVGTSIYDGFFYVYEDNEFYAIDGNGFRNFGLLSSRLSDSFRMRLKVANDRLRSRTNIDTRTYNNLPSGFTNEGDDVRRSFTFFRLQLDHTF